MWQELDDTFEERLRLRVKRRREEAGIVYTARRITSRQTSAAKSKDDTKYRYPDPKATGNTCPKLRINWIDLVAVQHNPHPPSRIVEGH